MPFWWAPVREIPRFWSRACSCLREWPMCWKSVLGMLLGSLKTECLALGTDCEIRGTIISWKLSDPSSHKFYCYSHLSYPEWFIWKWAQAGLEDSCKSQEHGPDSSGSYYSCTEAFTSVSISLNLHLWLRDRDPYILLIEKETHQANSQVDHSCFCDLIITWWPNWEAILKNSGKGKSQNCKLLNWSFIHFAWRWIWPEVQIYTVSCTGLNGLIG